MDSIIENAWSNRALLKEKETRDKIREVIESLDKGKVRVAEKKGDKWITHEWIKKSVILYFAIQEMETTKAGPLEFHDKIDLKKMKSKVYSNIRSIQILSPQLPSKDILTNTKKKNSFNFLVNLRKSSIIRNRIILELLPLILLET